MRNADIIIDRPAKPNASAMLVAVLISTGYTCGAPIGFALTVQPQATPRAISDIGSGMATDAVDLLFDAVVTTEIHGLGLGLSISRFIVTAHGGRIDAGNSPAGATFRIILPMQKGGLA
jgi:nitrogen-specific signal transduction histidine kinase